MGPERKRLLDLLVCRAYRLRAHEHFTIALIMEEFESDGRSRVFERWFDRARQHERLAYLVETGKMVIADGGYDDDSA